MQVEVAEFETKQKYDLLHILCPEAVESRLMKHGLFVHETGVKLDGGLKEK